MQLNIYRGNPKKLTSKPLACSNGIEHSKEFSEMLLKLIDNLIYHDNDQLGKSISRPRHWDHPEHSGYSMKTLRKSVIHIIEHLFDSKQK